MWKYSSSGALSPKRDGYSWSQNKGLQYLHGLSKSSGEAKKFDGIMYTCQLKVQGGLWDSGINTSRKTKLPGEEKDSPCAREPRRSTGKKGEKRPGYWRSQ
jgi:hypothetical protein